MMAHSNNEELLRQLHDALLANQVFHTPVALRRRGGQWDEYELDAIKRTREALSAFNWLNGSRETQGPEHRLARDETSTAKKEG